MKTVRLFLLSAIFLLLFNEPIISIVNDATLLGGIPRLYVYVLLVWVLLIGLIAYCVRQTPPSDNALPNDD